MAPTDQGLGALRQAIETEGVQVSQTAAERLAQQETDDRSLITRVVLYVFGTSIAGVLLVILLAGQEDGAAAVDVLKSVVLPVITLVLGYYFGRSSKP